MKKVLTFTVAVLLMSACGTKSKNAASTTYNLEDANKVIEYYNTAISATKNMLKESDAERVIEYMRNKGKRIGGAPATFRVIVKSDTTGFRTPSSAFPDEVRDSVRLYACQYMDLANEFYENYNEYKKYIAAEDYKDDNHAKGDEFLAKEEKLVAQLPELRSKIFKLITPFADKAEEATLTDNPLKDHIMAGKGLLSAIENTLQIYDPEMKAEDLQKSYNEIQKLSEAAQALTEVADQKNAMNDFKNFLETIEKFQGELRKQLRNGKFNERGYEHLEINYTDVVRNYNNFVN